MYLTDELHDLSPNPPCKSSPIVNHQRNSISSKPAGLTGVKMVKKHLSSPARLTCARNNSDMKRRQRTLDHFISPKKFKLESSSNSPEKSLKITSVRSLNPASSSPSSSSSVVDLTQSDSDKASPSDKLSNGGSGDSFVHCLLTSTNSSSKPNSSQSGTTSSGKSSNKLKKRKSATKLTFDDDQPAVDLQDMYNLFKIDDGGSGPSRTSPNVFSVSNDDSDLPTFTTGVLSNDAHASHSSGSESNVLETVLMSSEKTLTSSHPSSVAHCNRFSRMDSTEDGSLKNNDSKTDEAVSVHATSCTSSDDPVSDENSDEEIFCTPKEISLHHTSKMLNKLLHEPQPITPRKGKRENSYPTIDISSDDEKKEKIPKLKPHKITYTLNKILKEKKNNEELKNIEMRLLEDLKNGGFARILRNDSFEEEVPDSIGQDDPEFDKAFRIINTAEDCSGIEESHRKYKVFSKKRLFRCYCSHQVVLDEAVALMFCQDLNVTSRLEFLANDSRLILDYLANIQDSFSSGRSEQTSTQAIIIWLIQILSSHDDLSILTLAQKAFSSLIDCQRLQMLSANCFYKALCNLGIKTKFLHEQENFENKPCQKCKNIKHPCLPSRKLIHILKVFQMCVSKHPEVFDQQELFKLLTSFLFLSASEDVKPGITRYHLHGCIEAATNAMQCWAEKVLQVVRYIMQQIDDIHTLHYLVTTLPSNTERTAWLRNVLAYMALMTRLDKTLTIAEHEQEIKSNGVQIAHLSKLASKLSLCNIQSMCNDMKANLSNHQIYNILWVCMSLLQVCIGTERVQYSQRSHLESVSESFRTLSMSIRDVGSLYRSEAKYYIGLAIAFLEFRLQAMPKTQLYQQNIFKYLNANSVNEEIVDVDDADESPSDDSDHVPNSPDHCPNPSEDSAVLHDSSSAQENNSSMLTKVTGAINATSNAFNVALVVTETSEKEPNVAPQPLSSSLISCASDMELSEEHTSVNHRLENAKIAPEIALETNMETGCVEQQAVLSTH